ncbi:MAG TPA: carboxy terminal-processing peptidase [Saprospiraceae bacterium]|nr:carboxy terminal-processing peptidase [Saprospiraceae bacterium]MCB9271889.1 carboxy terminal-processing peptidase [Lewinellaceae bacterium]HPG09427.1 carboxy terminal-processing peptidase [Saprospiraceae bacterium]HQU51561.1 carboxy terminal-processing peptidase [Saprospiraceae bacterium]HRV86497.1 carboxy terminal-processing peptidase [Saprospiraceae bacterium]
MKFRSYFVVLLGAGLLFFSAKLNKTEYNPEKESVIMQAVNNVLKLGHFQPKDVDDNLSAKLYKEYLDNLDGGRRFLTQGDIAQMDAYKLQLDDEINNGTNEFFDLSYQLISDGVKKAKDIYDGLKDQPYDFTLDESIEFDPEKKPFAKDDAELTDYWRKALKYEFMTRLVRRMEDQESKPDAEKESREEMEKKIRESMKTMFDRAFNNWLKLTRTHRFDVYMNSFTGLFDPHTNYLTPKGKEDFDLRMSGALEGIGARLQADGDYTKVFEIVPGGPAFKQGDLQVNDLVLKVQQEGQDAVDAVGMHIDDVVSMIRGKKGTQVTITVKKQDGTVQDITIIRDKVVTNEEIAAQYLMLEDPEVGDKIGYINLESFYADLDGDRSCSQDVSDALTKLQADGAKGMILDLRNNGGGYLHEVIKMTGLFIEDGPVVQVKARRGGAREFDDEDKGVVYTGPLVVLVNAYSASASEIITAALQDYNRAVIVGGKATFGKGTVQSFYDLDQISRGADAFKPLGEIKMTTQKYYRINGGSTQLKGVASDIVLPDRYAYFDVGEREYDSAMDWSQIDPLTYNQTVYQVRNMDLLRINSQKRVASSDRFRLIDENSKRLKDRSEDTEVTLNLDKFLAERAREKEENKKYEGLNDDLVDLDASMLDEEEDAEINPAVPQDSTMIIRYRNLQKSVKKDLYIDESVHILNDMMLMDKSKVGMKE